MADQVKVKAVWFNDPSRTREFTKVAFEMITNPKGWILADNQEPIPQPEKKAVAAPAVANVHNEQELKLAREEYKTVTGQDAPLTWNEPKLFIETQKAKKNPPAPVIEPEKETQIVDMHQDGVENHSKEEAPKRKYTKKAKATA